MTPADHYAKAEDLLGAAGTADANMLAAALAHATLALAGATYLAAHPGIGHDASRELGDAIGGGDPGSVRVR